jgi:peptide/nickel transport system ATP-binding protein
VTDADLLVVDDLCVEYLTDAGRVRVVDGVSFAVRAGDVLGLAGESGSGKTSVVQAALRLPGQPAAITGGRVAFEGRDVLAMDDEALRRIRWARVSLVMQSAMNALNPVLTVGEQILDAIDAHDPIPRRARPARVAELLALVGIDPQRAGSYPHELSGGMRQRVVIAMALALRPRLVVMDEPTTALDVIVQREILERIAQLRGELGFAVLFISHDLQLMLEFCTRIGVMYAGRLVETAPAPALLAAPLHPYTRGLLASFPELAGPKEERRGIGGAPPDLRHPPAGCRFHPRCGEAFAPCAVEPPALRDLGGGRACACHGVTP